ncbi:NAD(P)H-dependent oxidoreductase [Bacteroidia bacterium]|nr:NAD(P)H-dependent oxidoreductase [Bacteroidia bacterium]
MKIGIISGSARSGNNTLRVAKAISNILNNTEIVDFQSYDIPSFAEGGLDKGKETEFQLDLIRVWQESDLVFVLSPEYNWFPSAEVINMINQLGNNDYKHIFDNKVVSTIGVSAGRGGRMPAVQLGYVINKIFSFFKLNSITSPKNFEAQEITQCIDSEGNLLDNQMFNDGLTSFLDYSVKVAKRWQVSD